MIIIKIITGDKKLLYKEVNNTLYYIEHGTEKEKISGLLSLEGLLQVGLMIDKNILNFDTRIVNQPYLNNTYIMYNNTNYKKFKTNFIDNKEFHNDYLKQILYVIGKELSQININYRSNKTTYLKEEECYEIINDFLKSINKKEIFDNLIINNQIFTLPEEFSTIDNIDNDGFVVFNICANDAYIILKKFDNTVKSMFTLMHELGHIIDFETIKNKYSLNDKNKLNMVSIYNEVMSKQYEKKFLNYLIDNNILKNEAIDILIDYYWYDYDMCYSIYILSLLKDNFLLREKYKKVSKEELLLLVKNELLINENGIDGLNLSISENTNYGYGAIVSEFLDEKLINIFYDNYRAKLFDKNFFINNDLNAEKFKKIYTKKLEKLI